LVGATESAEFLRQNRLIRQRWGPESVPVEKALTGLNHFSILDTLANPESELFAQVQHALAACAPSA
jgi:arylformamidase